MYTLNRIDNDGDYEPGNVEWATALVQSRNRRSAPWRQCQCGNRSPAKAKFSCVCGSALAEDAAALPLRARRRATFAAQLGTTRFCRHVLLLLDTHGVTGP